MTCDQLYTFLLGMLLTIFVVEWWLKPHDFSTGTLAVGLIALTAQSKVFGSSHLHWCEGIVRIIFGISGMLGRILSPVVL